MQQTTPPLPRQRTIVAWEVEGSATRTNMAKAALRDDMYRATETALLACQITEDLRDPSLDRGDGGVVMVPPHDQLPKTVFLHTFVPVLSETLAEHANNHPERQFRLRVAIHSGEVLYDRNGVFGADVDITFRLLDAPELKDRLRQTTAPLVLVVSDHIYRSVIRHGYAGIDVRTFEPAVDTVVAGVRHRGWVQVPPAAGEDLRPIPRLS